MKAIVKKIARLTENNAHTEAMVTAAEYMGFNEYANMFKSIMAEQDRIGWLDEDMYNMRTILYKRMKREAMDAAAVCDPEWFNEVKAIYAVL